MDDQGRQNLPNLKICVDNTEEGEIYDSDESLEPETAIEVDIEGKDGKEKAKEVEFSVRISDLDSENKTKPKAEVFTKKYENRDGDFITGIDLTSKEALEKKEERARRFGIEVQEQANSEVDIKGLYASLGLKEEDFSRSERGVRPEAIHIRGTDNMSTQDVFRYFREFAPGGIEWIDDASCNAVWADPKTAARAMLRLSDSYDSVMESVQEKTADRKKMGKNLDDLTRTERKGRKEDAENEESKMDKEEGKMEVDEYDDELDLVGESKDEEMMEEEKKVEKKEGGKMSDSDSEKSDSEDDKSKRKHKQPETNEAKNEDLQLGSGGGRERGSDAPARRRKGKRRIPWPPGKWRLGHETTKAEFLFLRFATKADKKLPRAESRSKYYVKYGNPNYGGMRGLISTSRKRRYRAKTYEEELAETKAAIESQRDAREARERGDMYHDDLPRVSPLKRKRDGSDDEGEELDMEAELQQLLSPPVRKQRSMRMYADDEEEKRNSRNRLGGGSSGVMTILASGRSKPLGRVKDARELIQRGTMRSQLMMDQERGSSPESVPFPRRSDLRMRIRTSPSVSGSDEESEEEEEEIEAESSSEDSDRDNASRPSIMSRLGPAGRASGESDSDSSEGVFGARLKVQKTGGRLRSDLRSRLGSRKRASDNSKYPAMRIEVFD